MHGNKKNFDDEKSLEKMLRVYVQSPECIHPGGNMVSVAAYFRHVLDRRPKAQRFTLERKDLEECCRFIADYIKSVAARQPDRAQELAERLEIPVGHNMWIEFIEYIERDLEKRDANNE